jgi:Zn-dependent metalloprotease
MQMRQKVLVLAVFAALGAGDAAAVGNSSVLGRALFQVGNHAGAARLSRDDRFVERDAIVDRDGTEHVRLDRSYRGLPVIGGDIVVHSRSGRFRGMSVNQSAPLSLSTTPVLDRDEATVLAGTVFGAGFTAPPEHALVVYARGPGPARLAWRVRLQDADADMTYVVDARDGALLDRWSNRETIAAAGSARTLYSGSVPLSTNTIAGGYELRDPLRGNSYTIDASNSRTSGQVYKDADNAWGNGATTDPATVAADAQYGMAETWDYYRTVHGRTGIANNGRGASSRVHYGRSYRNAFWSDGCFCMTYGDGDGVAIGPLVSLDIAGHEMSHGVSARTANLVYSGESGGLNEANSDILGTMVEFYANSAQDTPDYMIGEKIIKSNVQGSPSQAALRFMFNPMIDGHSPNCYVATIGNLDVHNSSGVANHFYYLLAEGSGAKTYSGVNHASPTCNGSTLAGIGRAKAQKIWYRALTVYFTSTTNYAGARVATIDAANDLYGVGSAEARAVAAAWSAVSVN